MDALHQHRLICAHRDGPFGVAHWNRQVERWLAEQTGQDYWPTWYAGRPLLVTRNDYALRIYNGEIGVCVEAPDGTLRGLINGSDGVLNFATTRLAEVQTMHALTVHKSQGSQAAEVTVLLPPEDSRLLTRELLYTAVTRAERKVRLVGSEAEVRAAVLRQAVRATGLRQRLAAEPIAKLTKHAVRQDGIDGSTVKSERNMSGLGSAHVVSLAPGVAERPRLSRQGGIRDRCGRW